LGEYPTPFCSLKKRARLFQGERKSFKFYPKGGAPFFIIGEKKSRFFFREVGKKNAFFGGYFLNFWEKGLDKIF